MTCCSSDKFVGSIASKVQKSYDSIFCPVKSDSVLQTIIITVNANFVFSMLLADSKSNFTQFFLDPVKSLIETLLKTAKYDKFSPIFFLIT